MKKLKSHEQKVYDFIKQSILENGYAPSVRDITEALGYHSPSTVHLYLCRLEEYGYIGRDMGKSRAISLCDSRKSHKGGGVPVLGKVTAGLPILAEENFDGYLAFTPDRKYDEDNLFALRISGTSMIGVGILDGDYVVVDKSDYAENGEIVVAMIDNEATVKIYFRENGGFRLQPANIEFSPIYVKELTVLGKVIAVVRMY